MIHEWRIFPINTRTRRDELDDLIEQIPPHLKEGEEHCLATKADAIALIQRCRDRYYARGRADPKRRPRRDPLCKITAKEVDAFLATLPPFGNSTNDSHTTNQL